MQEYQSTHGQILGLLKAKQGQPVPGPELASQLGISRTAVWKHMQKLSAQGYSIQTHPKDGYQLTDVPDLLIPEEIVPALTTSAFGRTYHHFQQLGSTNDQAIMLAMQGAPHGSVIVAEEQTEGRGRFRRQWLSAKHAGIYMSIVLRECLPLNDIHQSTLVTSLSLARIFRDHYGLSSSIKWPNDILIQHRKVSGILAEMQSDNDTVRFLVMGIGINANHQFDQLEGPFRYPATSLAAELGSKIKRQDLLLALLHQLEADYERLLRQGFGSFLAEFELFSNLLGATVTIRCGTMDYAGKVLGFTPQGALRLLLHGGWEEKVIWVGDVTQVVRNL